MTTVHRVCPILFASVQLPTRPSVSLVQPTNKQFVRWLCCLQCHPILAVRASLLSRRFSILKETGTAESTKSRCLTPRKFPQFCAQSLIFPSQLLILSVILAYFSLIWPSTQKDSDRDHHPNKKGWLFTFKFFPQMFYFWFQLLIFSFKFHSEGFSFVRKISDVFNIILNLKTKGSNCLYFSRLTTHMEREQRPRSLAWFPHLFHFFCLLLTQIFQWNQRRFQACLRRITFELWQL